MDDSGKAVVTEPVQLWSAIDAGFILHCPTYAIMARPMDAGPD